MSSSECGVLSSRGWTGGLALSMPPPPSGSVSNTANSGIASSDNGTISDQAKNTSNMTESVMTASSLSSQSGGGLAAPGNMRRGRASPSPVNRVPLVRQSEERKARRCRFYRNGDRWFPGALLAVSCDRHRTWDALLEDVTRLLEHPLHLAAGVRYVFTLEGSKIEVLEHLADSGEYVASSTDSFKTIDYRAARLPQWRLHTRRREALHVPASSSSSSRPGSSSSAAPESSGLTGDNSIRPRLVTVLRNGQRPRKAIRVLLNRRTARALDQVMEDLSTSLKLDTGAVRKIYTLDGRQITNLKELFQDDDVFIACGLERCSRDDFYLDNEESRSIQPLLKGPGLPGVRRRMPSPKPRGRAISPLPLLDQTGGHPRSPRATGQRPPSSPHISFPSSEDLFLPSAITSRYNVGRILGDGNFAVVRECKQVATRRKFALKIIDKSKCQGKEDMIKSEVDILRKVSHENIVRLEEEVHCPDYLYLVMELVTGGDLFDAIAAATRYTEREAGHLVRDLAAALHYLHQRNIVHRDVKPENLLVVPGTMPRLKLGDFGLAVQLTEPLYTICGTPTYVAPEILAEHGYGMEVDIWAAGVIAYILLCGFPPFISASNDQEELFEQILAGQLSFPSPYWDHVSPPPRHLIAAMVLVDPASRFTADQVLEHPWIKGQFETFDGAEHYQQSESYADYNEINDADHYNDLHYQQQQQHQQPPCDISGLMVPPPTSSDDDEHQHQDNLHYYTHNQNHHQSDGDNATHHLHVLDLPANGEEGVVGGGDMAQYDYQHNAILDNASPTPPHTGSGRITSTPPASASPRGAGGRATPKFRNRSKSPNHSNNSASSSSGIESYASSGTNDNNKYTSSSITDSPSYSVGDCSLENTANNSTSNSGSNSKSLVVDAVDGNSHETRSTTTTNGNANSRKSSSSTNPAGVGSSSRVSVSQSRKSKSPSKKPLATTGQHPPPDRLRKDGAKAPLVSSGRSSNTASSRTTPAAHTPRTSRDK